MRNRIYLDRNWFYHPVWDDVYISSPMVDETPVTLPHTVAETPLHYFDESIYQKLVCYQTILNDCPNDINFSRCSTSCHCLSEW